MHHTYDPRVAYNFANPERFHLSFSQRFFRFKASNWWNSLPSQLIRDGMIRIFMLSVRITLIGSCVVFNCRLVSVTIDYILSMVLNFGILLRVQFLALTVYKSKKFLV